MPSLTLLPTPRRLEFTGGTHPLETEKRLILDGALPGDLMFAAQRLQTALATHAGVEWALAASEAGQAEEIGAVLWVDAQRVAHPQGYELTITPNTLALVAHDPAGIFYGVCTLSQLLEQAAVSARRKPALPCLYIADHPDFPTRGVMLDISRDKVPTMETLYALVDMLASWKINQLQLYTEHTFSYRNHPVVWAAASPITEEEVLELDAYCRRRFIELVPNQNSFGHMHRWLKHTEYRPLAEVPQPAESGSWSRSPFGLCPLDPGSLALLESLYAELLPNFSSRLFNVGADETIDLGRGRSAEECASRGVGRVYLDFLLKLHVAVAARGHTMQFWGDIIVQHPELVPELPKDAIALEWGYEATHPFAKHGELFARSGVPFYVCPGTSSWNSIAGRTANALANLRSAAESGLAHGAIGYLNTDWGDNGHWQFLPVSFLGFAYGAAVSWACAANRDVDIVPALNRFAFRDAANVMGGVAFTMGNVYQSLGAQFHNASGLARVLLTAHQHDAGALADIAALGGMGPESYERAMQALASAIAPIRKQKMRRADARLIVDEYECAADMLHHACGLGLLAHEDDPTVARPLRRKLAANMKRIIAEYRQLWLARNRAGGLPDSVARLEAVLELYQNRKRPA
jgi:hypothetical protein